MESQYKKLVQSQRTFIHDVASPVSILQGMIDLSLQTLAGQPGITEADVNRLQRALRAADKLVELLQKNRDFLKSLSDVGAEDERKSA